MIWDVIYFACAVWLTWWVSKLLYVATVKGYVMALTRPFIDTVETRQTREGSPQKFWANVVFGLIFLPFALAALYFSSIQLYAALRG